jgi:alkylhydroperoxidase family enzyme
MQTLAIFRVAARNPRVLSRLRGGHLLDRGSICMRERELVVLRACARAGAEYEWGVHVHIYGARAQLSTETIAATFAGTPEDPAFSEADRPLIRLVDELHATADIGDELWGELRARWNAAQLVELVVLAGKYRMIGAFVKALRVPLEPGAPRFPVTHLASADFPTM